MFSRKEKSADQIAKELEDLNNSTTHAVGSKGVERKKILEQAPLEFLIERAATVASQPSLDNLAAQVEIEKRKNRLAFQNYKTAQYTLFAALAAVVLSLISTAISLVSLYAANQADSVIPAKAGIPGAVR